MEQTDQGRGGAGPAACQSTKDLLRQVTSELNRFEAKKLPELKAELEAFDKKKEGLLADYMQKYPALRSKWCAQHQQVEKLYAALKCAFPDWKKTVSECICKPRHEIYCAEQQIQKRKRCCQGQLERARDEAKERFDLAKARLDMLSANAQKISDELTAEDKLIKDIQGLLPGPDQEIVLYRFWFELLPAHKQLTPEDVTEDCKKFGDDEAPAELCKAVWAEECPEEKGACKPPDDAKPAAPAKQGRTAPWLLRPADYSAVLDCAWGDYHQAKDDFAAKDAEYKADPDDLAALGKKRDAQKIGLEDKIKTCLKQSRADDDCCTKPANAVPAPSGPKPPPPAGTPPTGTSSSDPPPDSPPTYLQSSLTPTPPATPSAASHARE